MAEGSLLITGASGGLGRLIAADLQRHGVADLVLGSRAPEALAGLVETGTGQGVRTVRVDFDDPQSLQPAFAGVHTVLIISTDALGEPGRRERQHAAALDAALAAGVKRVAYTSMPNPGGSLAVGFARDHLAMEAALSHSGLDHTVFRNGWYQENLLGYLPQIVRSGTWFTAARDGRIPFVSRADTALGIAAALASPEGGSQILDIAGPEYLTVDALASSAARVLGRPIVVEHVSQMRLADELKRQGVPEFLIPMVVVSDLNQRDGAFEVGPGDLPRLLGQPATTIDTFLRANKDHLLSQL